MLYVLQRMFLHSVPEALLNVVTIVVLVTLIATPILRARQRKRERLHLDAPPSFVPKD